MKRNILFPILLVFSFSISSCASGKSALDSSFSPSSSEFSYVFPNKQPGMNLEQFTNAMSGKDAEPVGLHNVKYTFHIVEKLTGTFYKQMTDRSEMPEGEIVGDFVSQPRYDDNGKLLSIKLINGTVLTNTQKEYGAYYDASLSINQWLDYHAQNRRNYELGGNNFEEVFYATPITLYFRVWSYKTSRFNVDGKFFYYEEFERTYDDKGYCTSFRTKYIEYIKGAVSYWNDPKPNYYNGSYEYTVDCTFEYLK